MRIPLILIAGMALVSLTACSKEGSEPNVQKVEEPGATQKIFDTLEEVQQRKNEWMEEQVIKGNLKFLPGEYSKGGKTILNNAQALCAECNLKKGNSID